MNSKNSKFLIYRIFHGEKIKNYQFGWTNKKDIARMFIAQRDQDKYKCIRVSDHELNNVNSDEFQDKSTELKMYEVYCKESKGYIILISTPSEIDEISKKLYQFFTDKLATLSPVYQQSIEPQIQLYTLLRDDYIDALNGIGFIPREIRDMNHDEELNDYSMDLLKNQINPSEEDSRFYFGHDLIDDWAQCIYSLEGLMIILKEEF